MIRTAMLLVAAAAILAVSCGDDPPRTVGLEPDEISWPAMTERDDVVRTIVLCYEYPKDVETMTKYNALLHSGYFFVFQTGDVVPGDPRFMSRADDIVSTEGIFEYESLLELTITPEAGPWYEYPELEGEPCAGCYETQRQYYIRAQFSDEEMVYQSAIGASFVSVIVSPDESNPSKWVLRALYDIGY